MEITIKGTRESIELNGQILDLEESLKIGNKSPSGFSWGYGGSGPAQLALTICIHLFGASKASEVYQQFKWQYIAVIPEGDYISETLDISDFVIEHQLQPLHL